MNEEEVKIYERIVELNHCLSHLNAEMHPLRQQLVDLSAQFTRYYKEKERLEKKLIKVQIIPVGVSGRIQSPQPKTQEQLLMCQIATMDEEALSKLAAQIAARMKGGGKS